MYDFLIVGAGFYGATFAHEATRRGKKCLVIDNKPHIGGLSYSEFNALTNAHVHMYGAHIFHTNNRKVWDFISQFGSFNNYQHRVKAIALDGHVYSFPINLSTFRQMGYEFTPKEADAFFKRNSGKYSDNAEDWLINTYDHNIYIKFFEYYTKKQYGRSPKELPASIVRRIRPRTDYNDMYFPNCYWQGIPNEGYTRIIKNMLKDVEVVLECDYFDLKSRLFKSGVKHTVYSGPIDKFYDYVFGDLEYNTLRFEHKIVNGDESQGCSVINNCTNSGPLRTIEHHYFEPYRHRSHLISISEDWPDVYDRSKDPMYPIATDKNLQLYNKYYSIPHSKVTFGGRIGGYQYIDMDQAIASALKDVDTLLGKEYEDE